MMQYDIIEESLFDNPLVILDQTEIKIYLQDWKKNIIIKIISAIPVICLTFFLGYLLVVRYNRMDIVNKCVGIGLTIFLICLIVYALVIVGNEIEKYYMAKTCVWRRAMAYIKENNKGKLLLSYVDEGKKCTCIVEKSYGEDSRRLLEGTYITFITILEIGIQIILKDIGWHK